MAEHGGHGEGHEAPASKGGGSGGDFISGIVDGASDLFKSTGGDFFGMDAIDDVANAFLGPAKGGDKKSGGGGGGHH